MKFEKLLACVFASLFLFPLSVVSSQERDQSGLEASAKLMKHPHAEFYYAEFDLGSLPTDTKSKIKLKLENPLGVTIPFSGISKSCNCMNLTSDKMEVPKNGSLAIQMELETPENSRNANIYSSIMLLREEGEKKSQKVNLKFKYRLSGVLSINEDVHYAEIAKGAEATNVLIPLVFTEPVKASDIKIEKPESFDSLDFKIVEKDGFHFLSSTVVNPVLDDGPISGEVQVSHIESGRKDEVYIVVRRGTLFKISPSPIRFRQANKSDVVEASALLRLPKSSDDQEEGAPNISASVKDGSRIDVKATKLSSRVYKLKLSCSSNLLSTDSADIISWRIKYNTYDERLVCSAVLVSTNLDGLTQEKTK